MVHKVILDRKDQRVPLGLLVRMELQDPLVLRGLKDLKGLLDLKG